ncbi:MAG TPA: hypothetical protein DD827_00035 [Gammaproteobacteria bacterium]|jgi:pimeloyl-ACP methyl ester carboxylesterase|nr:hypothetical protein [Gammaproteobacteria bacterium]
MKTTLLLILSLLPFSSHAGIAVFVHGYQSSGEIWHSSQVFKPLITADWKDAGSFNYRARQIVGPNLRAKGDKLLYTVNLPSNAPILFQVGFLHAVIQSIKQFSPEEAISLIGHSAGGIVARAVMVTHPEHDVSQLISIATPNLGTSAAVAGSLLAGSPVGIFARMIGEKNLSRSGQLLSDLAPPQANNFLGWLNSQPHPAADYIAIIRSEKGLLKGDSLISPSSQDLRNVWALQGQRVESFWSTGSHRLATQDGDILATILLRTKPNETTE